MSDTCTATTTPRPGVVLRCDRSADHDTIADSDRHWHYDFHQDADWQHEVHPVSGAGYLMVEYRTVAGGAR